MRWLSRVIALLQSIRTRVTVEQTPTAGPANPEPMTLPGKPTTAEQAPARTPRSQKSDRAPSTKAEAKPGKKKRTAKRASRSSETGSKSQTPANRTRRHVK
jgi:hypothetical protein